METDKKKKWFRYLVNTAMWIPPASLTVGGALLTFNSIAAKAPPEAMATNLLVLLYGLVAVDSLCGTRYASRSLSSIFRRSADKPVSQCNLLATTGVLMSGMFMYANAKYLAQTHGVALHNITDLQVLKNMVADHSIYKMASGPLFAASSLMDYPAINEKISSRLGRVGTIMMQGALSVSGFMLLGIFGLQARIRPMMYYGVVNSKARTLSMASRVANEISAPKIEC